MRDELHLASTHEVRTLVLTPLLFGLACSAGDLGDPPVGAEARQERWLQPAARESACGGDGGAFAPPLELLDLSTGDEDPERSPYVYRLRPELRSVAAATQPLVALAAAADAFALGHDVWGRALADLAVSGGRSYAALRNHRSLDPEALPTSAPLEARHRALRRALLTAWALRGPPEDRRRIRGSLGWIAVSPEDDPPHRPVNIPTGLFTQSDLTVSVESPRIPPRVLRTRVVVARERASLAQLDRRLPLDLGWSLPEERLELPAEGPIVLFIHGHASLAEEGAALFPHLVSALPKGAAVVAMDLPSNAYADKVDPSEVGPGEDAALRFLDAFIIGFVEALNARHPGTSDRIVAIVGGSLGGNLVLRLAEREDTPDWVRRVAAWSPASIDFSWSRASLLLPPPSGHFFDVVKAEAVRRTRDASEAPETDASREDYFVGGLMSVRNQAGYWYRDDWGRCGDILVEEGLLQLSEVYDARFRRWHYRLAYEQLVFSHIEAGEDGRRPFQTIETPLLLVAGEEDNGVPMQTYFFAERLAPYLTMPGETLFLAETGHAMHSERPRFLAGHIATFIRATPPR